MSDGNTSGNDGVPKVDRGCHSGIGSPSYTQVLAKNKKKPGNRVSPDVWTAAELRFIAGETLYSIAKDLPVSKTALQKRAKRDGWTREANGIVSERHRGGFPDLGADTPENRARVIDLLQAGGSYRVAAMVVGISDGVLRSWRKSDPAFEAQCTAARGHSLHKAEAAIALHSERDWKAAARRLSAAPETADQYRPAGAGGDKLEVVININRDDTVTVEGQVTPRHRYDVIEGKVIEPPAIEQKQSITDEGLLAKPVEPVRAEPKTLTQGEAIALSEKRRATEAEERAALEKRLRAEYVENQSHEWGALHDRQNRTRQADPDRAQQPEGEDEDTMSVTDLDILRAYPDRVIARAVQRMSELYADGPSAEEFAARIEADPAVQRAAAARGVTPAGLLGMLIGFES